MRKSFDSSHATVVQEPNPPMHSDHGQLIEGSLANIRLP